MAAVSPYELTIDLNVLKHLGLYLYSNIPAVLSEVVANSWDADADKVDIIIDLSEQTIVVTDDGIGMTRDEINKKYLTVGYDRRKHDKSITAKHRHVMGRKGIGKLALFAIADTIEVHSVKRDAHEAVDKSGFIMNAKDIEATINASPGEPYRPIPVDTAKIEITEGTRIFLRNLKPTMNAATERNLRRRLARRFSIIGSEEKFTVLVNGNEISVADRDYFKKVQFVWGIGQDGDRYVNLCTNREQQATIDGTVNAENDYRITGWVGTFDEQKSIEVEEGNNTVVILAWGKLIHEDILKDLKEGGVFTKYLIGEIRADFLDLDNQDDCATSDRQNVREDDPRFIKLKEFVQTSVLKEIQKKWRDWRKAGATKKATENPTIKQWFDSLPPDNKKHARVLFEKIESIRIDNAEDKKELYKHGILAFETLALNHNLHALESIDVEKNTEAAIALFAAMDELEAVHYWQITKNRVEVLKTFENLVPSACEKVIQKHLFDHLWLLDPSWERASTDAHMEESVKKEWKKTDADLTDDERKGRIDIRYRTAAGKHIIIELKKYDRKVTAEELLQQIRKYRRALEKCLRQAGEKDPKIEVICLLGSPPEPQEDDEENERILVAARTRYVTYERLIKQTRDSYRDYLDKEKEIGRIRALIESL